MKPIDLIALGGLLAITAASALLAAEPESAPTEVIKDARANTNGATDAKSKRICRTERVTGSRTKRNRVCMTKGEWDALAERTAQELADHSRGSSRATPQAGPMGGVN